MSIGWAHLFRSVIAAPLMGLATMAGAAELPWHKADSLCLVGTQAMGNLDGVRFLVSRNKKKGSEVWFGRISLHFVDSGLNHTAGVDCQEAGDDRQALECLIACGGNLSLRIVIDESDAVAIAVNADRDTFHGTIATDAKDVIMPLANVPVEECRRPGKPSGGGTGAN